VLDNLAAEAGKVKIGELEVNRIGLGTNRISDTPESKALLNHAVELGVNFIDTAHRYGSGASEITIGKTLSPYKSSLIITTKGGFNYDGENGSPAALRNDLEDSLKRLRTDSIDLYQLHRVDPKVPIEESIAALKDFQTEGKIHHIGLSEVTIDQLKAAQKIVDIVSVQNKYNLLEREYEDLVDFCTDNNIVFIPWFPLGGLDGGAEILRDKLTDMAKKYEVSAQQIALAWLLKRSPIMLPIPGTLSIDHLEVNLRSSLFSLSDNDFNQLSDLRIE